MWITVFKDKNFCIIEQTRYYYTEFNIYKKYIEVIGQEYKLTIPRYNCIIEELNDTTNN